MICVSISSSINYWPILATKSGLIFLLVVQRFYFVMGPLSRLYLCVLRKYTVATLFDWLGHSVKYWHQRKKTSMVWVCERTTYSILLCHCPLNSAKVRQSSTYDILGLFEDFICDLTLNGSRSKKINIFPKLVTELLLLWYERRNLTQMMMMMMMIIIIFV
jgi:hypothetical protein